MGGAAGAIDNGRVAAGAVLVGGIEGITSASFFRICFFLGLGGKVAGVL